MSDPHPSPAPAPRLHVKVIFGDRLTLGPGKADLLEHIRETGSISAAGRAMSMSYKRAWGLVEEMNTAFQKPLVVSARGGAQGGGAHLTEAGEAVLTHFRKLQDIMAEAGAARIGALQSMLGDISDEK